MARTELPADYIGNMTQLGMVLDAREVLNRDGATDAEWAANSMLIGRYSKGAYTATGRGPAVRVEGVALPAGERDYRPADWTRPTGNGSSRKATPAPVRKANGVTDPQRELLTRLINDNITDADTRATMLAAIDTLTVRTARPIIDGLIRMDRNRQTQQPTPARTAAPARKTPAQLDASLPTVPEGKYRVGDRNVKVDLPQHGQYAGRVFLVELDDEGRKTDRITRHEDKLHLLTAIAEDPFACMTAFGRATGACGKCRTGLEDPESIARGIGPYCEGEMRGMSYNDIKRDRKANPIAQENQPIPAPQAEVTAPAPAPAESSTPAAAPALDSLTAADVDALTFPQAMRIAQAIRLRGRGTARLPQLRDGIKAHLALAA